MLNYTIEQCQLLNIELTQNVPSGYFWNEKTCQWENKYMNRLVIDDKPILLIPKKTGKKIKLKSYVSVIVCSKGIGVSMSNSPNSLFSFFSAVPFQ